MSIRAITALWEAKQAQAQAKRHEADMLEAEARGLRQALEALRREQEENVSERSPSQISTSTQVERTRRMNPGRQPGAISNKWKRHLINLDHREELFNEDDVVQLVSESENRMMKPSEVKRLFENFLRYGHVKLDNDNFYYVPDAVIQRFKASLGEDNEDELEDQNNENEKVDDEPKSSDDQESDYGNDIALSVLNQTRSHRAV